MQRSLRPGSRKAVGLSAAQERCVSSECPERGEIVDLRPDWRFPAIYIVQQMWYIIYLGEFSHPGGLKHPR